MGWLSSIFRSSSKGKNVKESRGTRSDDGSARKGRRSEQDSGADLMDPEAQVEPKNQKDPQAKGRRNRGNDRGNNRGNDRKVEEAAVTVTAEDIEEARVLMESGDFRASIELNLKRVQSSLQQHQEAQTLRDNSRSVFAQGESIMEEAIRSAEAVSRAYEDGFAANSEANAVAIAKVREKAEDLRARLSSNQSAFQNVLAQATGMKEKATQDLLTAVESMNSAVINVAQELEESAKAASIADSTKESAMQELAAVQALWSELASLRQELLAQPVPEPGHSVPVETIRPVSQAAPAEETVSNELEEPYIVRQRLSPDAADILVPGLSGQEIEDQILDADRIDSESELNEQDAPYDVESLTGDPALDLEIANAQAAADFPGSAGASAADALRREMAGLAPLPDAGQDDLDSDEGEADAQMTATPDVVLDAPARSVASNSGPARTYGGRIYLMFDSSLTQEGLESVWDAVEEAANTGVIVDTRLVSRDEGVQVTLDLDESRLDVAAFLQRLPGAELIPMSQDRLKVAWPAAV